MPLMQALKREMPSTVKSVSTIRNKVNSASDRMAFLSPEQQDQPEQAGGRASGDIERNFGEAQPRHHRFHDANCHAQDAAGAQQRRESTPGHRPLPAQR